MNFPCIYSNIPAAPAYGVYISQLIRYSRACGSYHDFFDRELLLTRKLPKQGFLVIKLKSSLWKFYGRNHDLLAVTKYLFHEWPRIRSVLRNNNPVISSFMTYYQVPIQTLQCRINRLSGSTDYVNIKVFFSVYWLKFIKSEKKKNT